MKHPPSHQPDNNKSWTEATKPPEAEKRSAASGQWILSVVFIGIIIFMIFAYDYHNSKNFDKIQTRIDTTVKNLENKQGESREFEEKLRQDLVMAKAESETLKQELKNMTKLLEEKSKIQSALLEDNIRLQAENKVLVEDAAAARNRKTVSPPVRPRPSATTIPERMETIKTEVVAPTPVKPVLATPPQKQPVSAPVSSVKDAESALTSPTQKSCLTQYHQAILKSCLQVVPNATRLGKVAVTTNGRTKLSYQCLGQNKTHTLQFGPDEIYAKCTQQ